MSYTDFISSLSTNKEYLEKARILALQMKEEAEKKAKEEYYRIKEEEGRKQFEEAQERLKKAKEDGEREVAVVTGLETQAAKIVQEKETDHKKAQEEADSFFEKANEQIKKYAEDAKEFGEKALDASVSAVKTVDKVINEIGKTWSEAVNLIYSKTDEFIDYVIDTDAEFIKYLINDDSSNANEVVDISLGFVKGVFKGLKDVALLEIGCIDIYGLALLVEKVYMVKQTAELMFFVGLYKMYKEVINSESDQSSLEVVVDFSKNSFDQLVDYSEKALNTVKNAIETIFKQKFVDASAAERAENIGYAITMLVIILESAYSKLKAENPNAAPKDANDLINVECKGTSQCFVAGTMIATKEGYKAIEDIKVGDYVLSKDEETGETGYKPVLRTFVNTKNKLVNVVVNGTLIETTESPTFYVVDEGFKYAWELVPGDIVLSADGIEKTIESIETVDTGEVEVFNFEVEEWHTYFVSEEEVWVHNTCPKDTFVVDEWNNSYISEEELDIYFSANGIKKIDYKKYFLKSILNWEVKL